MTRSAAAEYRRGGLRDFLRLPHGALDEALREKRPDVDRVALADALRAYHLDLGTLDHALGARLERLRHPEARVVVTGQQAGVLSGPAYSVHKAADAALLARHLDREDAPVLAVYWVASQDHDAQEVASTTLLDVEERLHRLTLDLPEGVPVGRIAWREAWTAQVRELLTSFAAPEAHKAWVSGLVEGAVQGGGTVADVFARLIHALLAPAGLIVLDPMHPALAALMAPAIRRELDDPLASSRVIEEAAARLTGQGFDPQLRRPDGATNVFIEEQDGQRRLLRWEDGTFRTATRTYTREALEAVLTADPARLTPAAGVRPIVQDTILPTVAFVVGPGETAYGAQLRDVYPLHGLRQPLLWLRLSVTWLEPNVARLLGRLRATAAEVQADPEGVLGRALAAQRGAGALTQERLAALEAEFMTLTAQIAGLDPTLVKAARRAEDRTVARLVHLQRLALKALARAEDDRSGQLTRLKLHLLPNGTPQEREMNFLTFLLKHGRMPLDLLLALEPGWQGELRIP